MMRQSIFMMTTKLFLFQVLILFLSASAVAADKAYISVDESGQVEASDRPPTPAEATGTTEVISMPGSAESQPASEADEWQQRMERIDQMNEEMATELEKREVERATAAEDKKLQEEACAASRSRLQQLESQPPNRRLVTDSDGTAHRVTSEEMESLLEAARNQVEKDCGSLD
jgi:hypothetical protein